MSSPTNQMIPRCQGSNSHYVSVNYKNDFLPFKEVIATFKHELCN